jgi:CdiI immunity protein
MTSGKKTKDPTNAAPEFPALRDFLSGYLHQDFQDEYGSAVEAAKAFCGDASDWEIVAVRNEWNTWRIKLGNAPLTEIAGSLRALGAAWQPDRIEALDQLGLALGKPRKP